MWTLFAEVAIANHWTWTPPTQATLIRFEFDSPAEVQVDVGQGDGTILFGSPTRIDTAQPQALRFPALPTERRIAIRTADRIPPRDYALNWTVRIFIWNGEEGDDGSDGGGGTVDLRPVMASLGAIAATQQDILEELGNVGNGLTATYGTFTPILTSVYDPTVTIDYYWRAGWWTKIGKLCHYAIDMYTQGITLPPEVAWHPVLFAGLPFPQRADGAMAGVGTLAFSNLSGAWHALHRAAGSTFTLHNPGFLSFNAFPSGGLFFQFAGWYMTND